MFWTVYIKEIAFVLENYVSRKSFRQEHSTIEALANGESENN